jgi:hypothetical protein
MPAYALGVRSIFFVLLVAAVARGDSRTPFLAARLQYPPVSPAGSDFRVRANAALALGATNDDEAVAPLCTALSDPNEIVRRSVAFALRRLARASSLNCLNDRLSREAADSVKSEIRRALEAVEARAGANAPAGAAHAKYYVSLAHVANSTSRPSAEIDRLVHDAITSQLGQTGEYAIAPAGETTDAAKAALSKQPMKGYFLAVRLDDFDYSGGDLHVRLKVAVFSYPGKDLRGEIPAGASLPGAQPGDKGAEDELLRAVATRAAELFSQNFR